MPLPEAFQFNQAILQDAVECRRRFQLRYLLELAWPAPVAEPAEEYEAHARAGEAFHRLIHQHQLGLPVERLTAQAEAGVEVAEAVGGRRAREAREWYDEARQTAEVATRRAREAAGEPALEAGRQRRAAREALAVAEGGERAARKRLAEAKGGQTARVRERIAAEEASAREAAARAARRQAVLCRRSLGWQGRAKLAEEEAAAAVVDLAEVA